MNTGEIYNPAGLYPLTGANHFLSLDVAKSNLFWLVEPRVDVEGMAAAHENPIAEAISKSMDSVTRRALQGLPLAFLAYWDGVVKRVPEDETPALAQGWPWDYRKTMGLRAAAAQRRLTVISEVANVVTVQFRRQA